MDPGRSGARLAAVASLWARAGRTIEARFTGSSMEPAVPDGGTLRLRCGAPIRVGDVAALVHDGHVLVHRVIALRGPWLLTRGDARAVPDPPLPRERAFARVEAVQQQGGGWVTPDLHHPSTAQRLVAAGCAFSLSPLWTRAVVALLRRLSPRRPFSRIDVVQGGPGGPSRRTAATTGDP